MGTFILLVLIFALPFVVHKVGISSFETPKVLIAEGLIGILAFSRLVTFKMPPLKSYLNPNFLILIFLILLSVYHTFTNSQNIFFGNIFRLQGVFLLWSLIILSVTAGNISLSKKFRWVYLIALSSLAYSAFYFNFNPANRAVGVLGEPNALASVAVIFYTFIFFSHRNLIRIPALILVFIVLYFTHSRSATIALGVMTIFYFLHQYWLSVNKSVIIALLVILSSLFTPFLGSLSTLGSTITNPVANFEDRSDIWMSAVYAGLQNPLFGVGFGNIQDSLKMAATELNLNSQYSVVDSSHNFILDYWVAGGIVGVGLLLSLLYFTIKNLIISKKIFELTLLFGVITVMLFNPVTVVVLIVFWWLIGRGIFASS